MMNSGIVSALEFEHVTFHDTIKTYVVRISNTVDSELETLSSKERTLKPTLGIPYLKYKMLKMKFHSPSNIPGLSLNFTLIANSLYLS